MNDNFAKTMGGEDVLVIGAGPAGIASAYALQKAGLRYIVIDRATVIGSTWQQIYPSLRLNTTRFFSHLPGRRFAWYAGIFPKGRYYHQYLEEYVADHNFNIQLGVTVYRVAPKEDVWQVETSEGVFHYPAVICATGVFGNPIIPQIDGMEDFAGQIIHAHHFKSPQQFTARRVLVVGNGPSGIDIATACVHTAARPVYIAIRTGIDFRPRYPYGLPKHAWMMIAEKLPKPLCQWLMRKIDSARLPIPKDSPLQAFIGNKSSVTIPYQGPELVRAVARGDVIPVRHPIRFDKTGVELADGSYLPCDAVILATSYQPVLHQYLDIEMHFAEESTTPNEPCNWDIGPNGTRGWPLLDRSQHPNGRQVLNYAGLYLVGTFYKGKGAMYNFHIEADIAAQQIKTYLAKRQ